MADPGDWLWPDVSSVRGARKASIYGFCGAALTAALSAATTTFTLVSQHTPPGLSYLSAYFNAAVFFALALGIHAGSRAAALIGLLLFIVEKAGQIQTGYPLDGWWWAATPILGLGLVAGVRGAYASYAGKFPDHYHP
jgi:hypothetical protein